MGGNAIRPQYSREVIGLSTGQMSDNVPAVLSGYFLALYDHSGRHGAAAGKDPIMFPTGTLLSNMPNVVHSGFEGIGDTSLKAFSVYVVDRDGRFTTRRSRSGARTTDGDLAELTVTRPSRPSDPRGKLKIMSRPADNDHRDDDRSGLREGEIAVELPSEFDAQLYFIGRIRTPWQTRDDCPKNGRETEEVCTIEVDPRSATGLQGWRR